jgi:SAM-dependent methyltransferase
MTYALENKTESERLETQACAALYALEPEFRNFLPQLKGAVLDAGSGSGVVSRHLARSRPDLRIHGCDLSPDRVAEARLLAEGLPNLEFSQGSLLALPFADRTFGSATARFVIQHLDPQQQIRAMSELNRVLKPGGVICVVDLDGMYDNLYPMPEKCAAFFRRLAENRPVDLHVGRRLPHLLSGAGFEKIDWRIDLMDFRGENLSIEIDLMRDRVTNALPFISGLLGSQAAAEEFEKEFINGMRHPHAVMFYNKFIVTARKPSTLKAA